MMIGEAFDIARLLRSLPDMEPPPDAWQKIRAAQPRVRPGAWVAVAASVALLAIVLLTRDEAPVEPVGALSEATLVVEAETRSQRAGPVERSSASVGDLRRRSQHMERVLRGLPKNPDVVRVDLAGAIADLQHRIAAVDYELSQSTQARRVAKPSVIVRWPSQDSEDLRPVNRSSSPSAQDLWRQRVDLMDRLVRARYVAAGAEAY